MRKIILFLWFLGLIAACTMNSDQEASLAESTNKYLEARRKGALLAYVSMNHPAVVKAYKSKGDSVFVEKFDLKQKDYLIDDPVIKDIVKRGETIHVLYEAHSVGNGTEDVQDEVFIFVAISENDGKSWFYMEYEDYVDKTIATSMKRLVNK